MSLKDFKHKILPIKDQLYRFSLRIVGNVAEAEDVVQEVFIKLWNGRGEWEKYNNIEAWSMRLTKNLSIDKLRSKHNKVGILPEGFDLTSTAATPHRQTELNDTVNKVHQLMKSLPEKQRLVMQLRDIEEKSYQEIAEIMDIPINQVKVNLFRARKQIREQLINTESYGL